MAPIPFDALEAFVQEHQRCDVLDDGVDNGFVWLQCSCGGLIMHPAGKPPKKAPAGTSRPGLCPVLQPLPESHRLV
jgi:hypothetical protein